MGEVAYQFSGEGVLMWRAPLASVALRVASSAMNPLKGTAQLYADGTGELEFRGTCFAFRHSTHFLTAAHCVEGVARGALAVHAPDGLRRRAIEVVKHPEADLALLLVAPPGQAGENQVEPFWNYAGNLALGQDFIAYGYPKDALGPNVGGPTPRVFKGYYQRFMDHRSHLGYRYVAGEMSNPCPAGLSGGPLFRPGAHSIVTGLAAETIEVATFLAFEELAHADGRVVQEYQRSVVQYGIAVMLFDVKDWIDEHIPPRQR